MYNFSVLALIRALDKTEDFKKNLWKIIKKPAFQ